MEHKYAFFDVDCIELASKGITFVCHPQFSSKSELLFEVYSIISGIAAPLVFSVDVNRNVPAVNKRRDYLSIPVRETEIEWKESVADKTKFYIERKALDSRKENAVFNNNENAIDCVKKINPKEWIVFGNGIEFEVDHVISTLIGLGKNVKFIPELIMPGETEQAEQLDSYFQKWIDMGATPISYEKVILLARQNKIKKF